MSHIKSSAKTSLTAVLLALVTGSIGTAAPVMPSQASAAVSGWLKLTPNPLMTSMGQEIADVETHMDRAGNPLFHVVSLAKGGFVVMSADDELEPVVAFADSGKFIPDSTNPLFDILMGDMQHQVKELWKGGMEFAASATRSEAKAKWDQLLGAETRLMESTAAASVSDPRVDPMVLSTWSQGKVKGANCYNYYTPNGYPTGCVATAMAQLVRFHQHPATGVGAKTCYISVDDASQTVTTRGGDGNGGAYDWSLMPLSPASVSSLSEAQRSMIGALLYDVGLSLGMGYKKDGSNSDSLSTADGLKKVFRFSNAVKGYNYGEEITGTPGFLRMVNPNLDAGLPVLIGITGPKGGHCVVADGYGYNNGTLYHHLNLGWSGSDTAWYALPNVGTWAEFTKTYKVVYNIFPTGRGEIISGRVLDANKQPVAGVEVKAGSYAATTNERGIYALTRIPSGTYTVTASKPGYAIPALTGKVVGTSSDRGGVGNLWNVDFTANVEAPKAPSITAQPQSVSVATGQSVTLSVAAAGTGTLSYQWYMGTTGQTSNPVATGSTFTSPAMNQTASYWVRVSSPYGSVDSNTATVSVNTVITENDLIKNGDFEGSAVAPWIDASGAIGAWQSKNQPAYAGSRCAWLVGTGKTASETLSQTFDIPANAVSATLSFYLHIDTAETGNTAYDKLVVQVVPATGSQKTLATFSNVNANAGYVQKTFDLSSYKGKKVTLTFKATEDESLQTSFVIDNVSMIVK